MSPEQDALVESHVEFAKRGARHYARRHNPAVTYDDLESAALFGLVEAAQKFDPSAGAMFKTFAFHVIDRRLRDVYRRARRYQGWGGRHETRKTERRLVRMEPWPTPRMSDDGGIVDFDPPSTDTLFADIHTRIDLGRYLTLCLSWLPDARERHIFLSYLRGVPVRETALDLGISRQRVSQIQQRAVARLMKAARTEPQKART